MPLIDTWWWDTSALHAFLKKSVIKLFEHLPLLAVMICSTFPHFIRCFTKSSTLQTFSIAACSADTPPPAQTSNPQAAIWGLLSLSEWLRPWPQQSRKLVTYLGDSEVTPSRRSPRVSIHQHLCCSSRALFQQTSGCSQLLVLSPGSPPPLVVSF